MPRFSVLMPTYNRADTILRAIASIQAQTFGDWELVVTDDGSTDGTADRIAGLDPRLRIIRQANQGLAGARNTGLRAAKGQLIAFLDSDDEWLPHHLQLASDFFEAHPDAQVLTGEFWEDFGDGRYVKHFQIETGLWAPQIARRIGSRRFDGEPPEGDPYLRVYQTRAPAGPWARRALEGTPYADPLHYSGRIFDGWRWEWLMAVQSTVITPRALEAVGLHDTRYPVSCDYCWGAKLSSLFPVHMLNVPACIKHEYGLQGSDLKEGHLVTGRTATQFHREMLEIFEEHWGKGRDDDAELRGLRGYRQLRVAQAALSQGKRAVALEHLRQAVANYPGAETSALRLLAQLSPGDAAAQRLYHGYSWVQNKARRLLRRKGV